ncbi:MAG: flagellar hook-basal body complex protein FliE [Hyphomicrobiales bacterium]|nr:flagellar hook-basal body complex protein FliE [Hyphomicrobiales bacterium]
MVDAKINLAASAYKQAANIAQQKGGLPGGDTADVSFSNMVGDAVSNTTQAIGKAEMVGQQSLVNAASMDDLVLAVSNAELALKTIVAVRDRVISAYQDIIKMPV